MAAPGDLNAALVAYGRVSVTRGRLRCRVWIRGDGPNPEDLGWRMLSIQLARRTACGGV